MCCSWRLFPRLGLSSSTTHRLLLIATHSPLLKLLGLTPSSYYVAWPAKCLGRRRVFAVARRPSTGSPQESFQGWGFCLVNWLDDAYRDGESRDCVFLMASSKTKCCPSVSQFLMPQHRIYIPNWHCALTWSANQLITWKQRNVFSHLEAGGALCSILTPTSLKQRSFTLISPCIRHHGRCWVAVSGTQVTFLLIDVQKNKTFIVS